MRVGKCLVSPRLSEPDWTDYNMQCMLDIGM